MRGAARVTCLCLVVCLAVSGCGPNMAAPTVTNQPGEGAQALATATAVSHAVRQTETSPTEVSPAATPLLEAAPSTEVPSLTTSASVTRVSSPDVARTGQAEGLVGVSATASSAPTPTATLSAVPTVTPTERSGPTSTPTLAPTSSPTVPALVFSPALPGTSQNFQPIGHHDVGSIGWHGGLALKDDCAYVGNYAKAAVSILDISAPMRPSRVEDLTLATGAKPVELRTLAELDLLVVADLGLDMLLTFDVSECSEPKPLGSIVLPGAPHEFYLWRDGSQVLAYAAMFDHAPPALVVVDLTDPEYPRQVASWSAGDDGVVGLLHSLSVSGDGSTAYLAMWDGGLVVAETELPRISPKRDADGNFSQAWLENTHSAVGLEDPRFVLLASEIFGCPFSGLAVADISDPAHPSIIEHFSLPENRCGNLPQGDPVFAPHNPLVVGDLAFISWYGAGVQVVDLSDPRGPKRVGQFVPDSSEVDSRGLLGGYPVEMISYPILREGLIYVVDSSSGLHILRYIGPDSDQLMSIGHAEGNVSVGK